EDGIRDRNVTGVQTCALPIFPLGIWSATKRNTTIDVAITGGSVLGSAIPNFWLGIMLILLLAVNYQIFPVSGRGTLMHLVLPSITLGTGLAATIARLSRSSFVDLLILDSYGTDKVLAGSLLTVLFARVCLL